MTADTLRAPLLPTAVASPEPPLLASRSLWASPRRSNTPPAAFAPPPARPDSFAAATAAGPVMCAFHFHAGAPRRRRCAENVRAPVCARMLTLRLLRAAGCAPAPSPLRARVQAR